MGLGDSPQQAARPNRFCASKIGSDGRFRLAESRACQNVKIVILTSCERGFKYVEDIGIYSRFDMINGNYDDEI